MNRIVFLIGAAVITVAGSPAYAFAPPPPNCLQKVWQSQRSPNQAFDRSHDQSGADSISCATLTSPSAFEHQLAKIRKYSKEKDFYALANEIDYPLIFISNNGKKIKISKKYLIKNPRKYFTPKVLKILSSATLENMSVVRNKGAFFSQGSIWFYVNSPGGYPKISTINLQTH